MIWQNDAIRRALSSTMPTWREKFSWGVTAVAILLFAGWYWRYGGPWNIDPQKDAQLANGWVMNCSGPEFNKFSQMSSAGSPSGTSRPVFKINDQLVLAVPQSDWPSAGRIEGEPRDCRTLGDLPKVHYLYFVIRGNWSGSYDPKDVPLADGRKKFMPDAVTVRVELESPMPVDARRELERYLDKTWNDDLLDKRKIGGLTCGKTRYDNNRRMGGLRCSGRRSPLDPDVTRFTTRESNMTPFYQLEGDYESPHYGGIRIYWNVWTLDVAHGRDIDQAIWNSLAEWNLVACNIHL